MTMQRSGVVGVIMVLPVVTGTCQVQYRQNIASRAEINPPAYVGGNNSTFVLVHVLRLVCMVRSTSAREAAVPQDPFLGTRLSRSLNELEGPYTGCTHDMTGRRN